MVLEGYMMIYPSLRAKKVSPNITKKRVSTSPAEMAMPTKGSGLLLVPLASEEASKL